MKRTALPLFLVCLMLAVFAPQVSQAAINAAPAAPATEKPVESAEATQLLRRLDEIKAMDKSNLNRTEKKALRQEVKGIKKDLRAVSGGIYLSVGAIIVIALLLILLL